MVAKILVVDDQANVGRAIARMLPAYETSTETDPRSAIRRVADGEQFDIVLCDLEMPGLSGKDVYDAFQREHGGDRAPLMLMMSGHGNVTALFAAGCPVLLKPFEAPELRALVSAILHETPADSSASPPR
jgi:two-component system, cell cycle sensor histidine kinase and response regulator CckA